MLKGAGHVEVGEDHDEDEQVVNGEGFFEQVAGEEFKGLMVSHERINRQVESKGGDNPDRAPDQGFPDLDLVGLAVDQAEVHRQHHDHNLVKRHPPDPMIGHRSSPLVTALPGHTPQSGLKIARNWVIVKDGLSLFAPWGRFRPD